MKTIIIQLIVATALGLFFTCNSTEDTTGSTSEITSFSSSCAPARDEFGLTDNYFITQITIDEGSFSYLWRYFSDDSCSSGIYSFIAGGQVASYDPEAEGDTLSDNLAALETVTYFQLTFDSLGLTFTDSDTLATVGNVCGTALELLVELSLLDLACEIGGSEVTIDSTGFLFYQDESSEIRNFAWSFPDESVIPDDFFLDTDGNPVQFFQ